MADFIFSPIKNEPEIELLIIMVLIPIIMNGISVIKILHLCIVLDPG